ncbi:hypothetical protein CAPTEDRAFT_196295 [Capitella teleta]|uniref:Receptor ligand binding region domain-containing protein n=1 Tax=Capitella teleta TaxID=283909 RepID=R7T8Z2_CAPTE|nr:hypothetical protein CAPTEDRAFT_196295 [Capitella teleta]|eukprot:ELT87870.1 hypothetical protein CAPTEDRAFT_196295 [Capitella teleta]
MDIGWAVGLLLLLHACCIDTHRLLHKNHRKQILTIAGFFNLSRGNGVVSKESGFRAEGIIPAVRLAVRHINRHPDILPRHKLKVNVSDTQGYNYDITKILTMAKTTYYSHLCKDLSSPHAKLFDQTVTLQSRYLPAVGRFLPPDPGSVVYGVDKDDVMRVAIAMI